MNKKILVFLLSLIFAFALGVNAYAAGLVDTNRDVKLTVSYSYDDAAIPDAHFDIYRVASVSQYGYFTLVSPFDGYSVSLDDIAKDEGRTLAQTLASYAERDKITTDYTAVTDSNGVFTVNIDAVGMYLVVGKDIKQGKYIYMAEPFLIALPNKIDGQWSYDVAAMPKSDRKEDSPLGPGPGPGPSTSYIGVSVKKTWSGDSQSVRPAGIEVQLLHDGTVTDTVVLNSANGWEHTWSNLEDKGHYSVVEKSVPKNYTVSVDKDGNSYEIVNKYIYVEPSTEDTTKQPDKDPDVEPTTHRTVTPPSGGGGGRPSDKAQEPKHDNDTPNVPGDKDDPTIPPDDEVPDMPPDEVPDLPEDPNLVDESDIHDMPNDGDSTVPGTDTDIYNDNTLPGVPPNTVTDSSTPGSGGILPPAVGLGGGEPTLPQTGQLWWPVPVMGTSGMMLFALGCVRRRKKDEDNA